VQVQHLFQLRWQLLDSLPQLVDFIIVGHPLSRVGRLAPGRVHGEASPSAAAVKVDAQMDRNSTEPALETRFRCETPQIPHRTQQGLLGQLLSIGPLADSGLADGDEFGKRRARQLPLSCAVTRHSPPHQ
jgi:hypothetical protein